MSCLVASSAFLLVHLAWTNAQGNNVVRPTFHPPMAGDSVSAVCTNFTFGNWEKREFFSPGYPDKYPNITECIHLIIAPKGYRIRLDFRNDFHIEISEGCKYDYLEFRDGPFGYSPLIGRYCGVQHPKMMESTTRFLWVVFFSDDSIQYTGFHAVYNFLPVEKVCRIIVNISNNDGEISSEDIPQTMKEHLEAFEKPLDCTWAFYLPVGHRLMIRFEHLQTMINTCEDSFLEIYEESTAITNRRKQVCNTLPIFHKTNSNYVYIRNYGTKLSQMPSFTAYFTVFQPEPCGSGTFDCGDGTCINQSLQCNGVNNCNHNWDEASCDMSTTAEPTREPFVIQYHTVIIGIVGGAILTIIFLAIVITCYQMHKEQAHQRHALRPEERQLAVEVEMTNLLRRSPQHIGANAVAGHPTSNPNGPMNHTGAARAPVANHVTPGPPQLRAHSQAISTQQNGHTADQQPNVPQSSSYQNVRPSDVDGADFSGHNGGGGNFGRYLGVHGQGYNNKNEDSNPNPSTQNQIPIVATIEKRPSGKKNERKDKSRSPVPRDRTPSPRPDVVQEEKFTYPESKGREYLSNKSPQPRRMSNETERSDRSDVWKPMSTKDVSKAPSSHKPQAANLPTAPPPHGVWSRPPDIPYDSYEPHSERHREGIGFEPIADAALYARSMPKQYRANEDYGVVDPSGSRGAPPAPPQRRTATLQHQSSAPMPPTEPVSPPQQRHAYSRTPPAKPRIPQSKSSSSMTPTKSRQHEQTPTMFYTRPNPGRSERNLSKQHHPV